MRLFPTLGLLEDELPSSLMSRLARLHGIDKPDAFCRQLGIAPKLLSHGETGALQALAYMTGAPYEKLGQNAVIRTGAGYLVRGEIVRRRQNEKTGQYVCANCVTEDLEERREIWRSAERLHWSLPHLRTCRKHRTMLFPLAKRPGHLANFTASLDGQLAEVLECAATNSASVLSSSLEEYLSDRLDAATGPAWLDALPWYAAARTCEMLGAIHIDGGKVNLGAYTHRHWREAGDAGFKVASRGPGAIYDLLEQIRSAADANGGSAENPHLKLWFGKLYYWLGRTPEEDYDPLRQILIEFARQNIPLGPEDTYFGRPVVTTRLYHSLQSAIAATGVGRRTLRRNLEASGFTTPEDQNRIGSRILISVTHELEDFLERASHAVTRPQAAKHISAAAAQMRALIERGYIKSLPDQEGLRTRLYDKRELDAFLARLYGNAVPITDPTSRQITMARAANLLNRDTIEIVGLIIDNSQIWKGRLSQENGLRSILVDIDELKRLFILTSENTIKITDAARIIRVSVPIIRKLIQAGHLRSFRSISSKNGRILIYLPEDSVYEFHNRYVSTCEISETYKVGRRNLVGRLIGVGAEISLDHNTIGAVFIRRDDLPIALKLAIPP